MDSSMDYPSESPRATRQVSRVPGGFDDTDDELPPSDTNISHDNSTQEIPYESTHVENSDVAHDNSMFTASSETGGIALPEEASTLEEREIRRRLMDEDSTFLPPLSPFAGSGRFDSLTSGSVRSNPDDNTATEMDGRREESLNEEQSGGTTSQSIELEDPSGSPETPSGMYKTPAPRRDDSSQGSMSSSPTAQAAARRPSYATSTASMNGSKTRHDESRATSSPAQHSREGEDTPRKPQSPRSNPIQEDEAPTPTQPTFAHDQEEGANGDTEDIDLHSLRSRKRPKFFSNRVATQTSSYSTYTTTSTQADSDLTVGADYALQTGGAAPFGGSTSNRPRMDCSRTTSLGSMASGLSGFSEDEKIGSRSGTLDELQPLSEEGPSTIKNEDSWTPKTPRVASTSTDIPTDTVLAQRVKDVEVPATAAREYRERHRPASADKRLGVPASSISRNGRSLTLKEQSGTIDRLTKENFDLKMKITFLNDSLNKRSPEGVASLVNENADLKAAKVTSAKEIRDLKRSIRDLERTLRGKEGELAEALRNAQNQTDQAQSEDEDVKSMEEELMYLRNRVVTYDVEIEKVRHERFEQKQETDRLARLLDYRKSHGSDMAAQEEINMYKEDYETELARREQADQENEKLREQIWQLENGNPPTNGHFRYNDPARRTRDTAASEISSSTLTNSVDQLQHENARLRREVGAQMSMLTSRNREKQELDRQIEELRLAQRRDDARSIAGDSVPGRSMLRSHGRPISRASDATRTTQLSDAEREGYENRISELRDKNSALSLEIAEVTEGLESCIEELDRLDGLKSEHQNLQQAYERDLADLQGMQAERDEALRLQEDLEFELEDVQTTARDKITTLMHDVQEKNQELNDMETELKSRDDALAGLQHEVNGTGDRIARLEDEMKAKDQEILEQEAEVETTHMEYKKLESDYKELRITSDRDHVQNEAYQKEINFLREEQTGDKIRIGDLEAERTNLKDRTRELENRLAQEKHQREVIDSKEKREVQKIMDDLNHEISEGKAESRDLKQSLQSREVEVTTFKERLLELESNLREILDEPNGTRSSLLTSITRLQKELDSTATELDLTKNILSQKENLLRNRDALLESHGLESKKLSDLLDRERQARRVDKAQHEQWQKTHQHTSRTVTQKDQRITELEHDRQSIKKKLTTLETQFKDQLQERNQLLLTLWDRLAPMCGSDWQHQNNLVNNHVPTVEVVSSQLPGFSKNLLAATKTIEGLMMGFKGRIRAVERDLWKEYQQLETDLDSKTKKIDKLEATVQSNRVAGTFSAAPEIAKLRGENRLLKSEIAGLQNHARAARTGPSPSKHAATNSGSDLAAPPPSLSRSYTSSHIETLERAKPNRSSSSSTTATLGKLVPTTQLNSQPLPASELRWQHRLKELERRLKAEREARILDRTAARKRLEEGMEVNEMLKSELEREKARKAR